MSYNFPAIMKKDRKIMIVAGEVSGDSHGAKLVDAIRNAEPDCKFEFFGAASHSLRAAGVEAIVNADDLAITGLPEIARALPMFWKAFNLLKRTAVERKPDAVILIDFPDFNLKLAKSLKKAGLKVIYYISPQLWAWRKYRISTIRKYVDLLITILPFEKKWYADHGVHNVEYVGNPLVREVHSNVSKIDFCTKHNIDPAKPLVALLPGSRHKEFVKILPVFLDASRLLIEDQPDCNFIVAMASTRKIEEASDEVTKAEMRCEKLRGKIAIVKNETYDALNAADAAAVASGTATLETTIIGTPFTIVYKASGFNYKLLRPLIEVEHFGLVNLIAEERLVKEFIQEDMTPENISNELKRLLDHGENRIMRDKLREISDKLGHGGASKRAAEAILKII